MPNWPQVQPAPGSSLEEETTLIEAARRDPAAFGELYRRYVARIYRYLFSHVGERADAEDLTTQVFTAALEGIQHYREQGNFAAWIFRIARNKIADYHRSRRNHLSLEDADDQLHVDWDPLDHVERNEAMQRLARMVKDLDPEHVELLRLRFAADLSFGQMANLLGRSEASVKMMLHRLLNRLQAEWEKYDE